MNVHHLPLAKRQPEVSEFYVHAVLQAAKAFSLGRSVDEAKSFGLNRAIFYEAAKKGYIGRGRRRAGGGGGRGGARGRKANFGIIHSVGGERAYAVSSPGGELRFVIGGKAQTPQAFDKQIKRRFPNWPLVWEQALAIVGAVPRSVLCSAHKFHEAVYKHWRGALTDKWPKGESVVINEPIARRTGRH